MKKTSGFTLLELIVTVAIVGILFSVGMPSLKTLMQGNQLIAATNELISAIHVARSEAIKLNKRVSICASSDGSSCSDDSDWSKGWIVFSDALGSVVGTDADCTAANADCLLRVHDGFDDKQLSVSGVDSTPAAAVIKSLTFTSRGLPKSIAGVEQSGIFSVCSFDNADNIVGSRAVVVSITGRVRVSDNKEAIKCPSSPPA